MESTFAIYAIPAPIDGDPIGYVSAETRAIARRKVARFIKLGYWLRLIPQ